MSIERCPWSLGVSDAYLEYHDTEWGVPVRDDRKHFEFLMLEGAQAGLSWSTVLHKRDAYRRAFAGFDPAKVARFNARSVERLLKDPGILLQYHRETEPPPAGANRPVEIEPRLDEVERILKAVNSKG